MVEISVDTNKLQRVAVELIDFGKKEVPRATVAALNRAAASAATETKREAKKGYEIKEKDLMRKDKKGLPPIRVQKASASRMSAGVLVVGRPKGLFNFKVKKPKGKQKYVKVKIKKGGGFKQLPPNAFILHIADRKGNAIGNVYARTTKHRYPLARLATLSVPQMVSKPEALANIQKKAQETLERRIDHEIDRRLSKVKGE